ncbi:MAG: prolyl oligopeptidase family serine peptidase [Clostridia bacterium]|nr:prolyl oligopeptidase family serine peptidase [Clostridia bacterium]
MKTISLLLAVLISLLTLSGCTLKSHTTSMTENKKGVKQVKRKINEIPVLEFYKDDGKKKPLLLVSHGFTGKKEAMNKDHKLEDLAEMGYYVVALDNRMHGERPGTSFTVEAVKSLGKLDVYVIRKAIKETADDIKVLIDTYSKEEIIDKDKIGMMGVSMGGFVTYRAMVIDDRIKVAVPFISSPFWDDIPGDIPKEISLEQTEEQKKNLEIYANEYSPGNQLDKFYPRAILGQVGDSDKHFKVRRVEDFYGKLKKEYEKDPDKLKLIVYPNVKHEVTEEMWENALEWLKKYL